jgi:hypothetical protein
MTALGVSGRSLGEGRSRRHARKPGRQADRQEKARKARPAGYSCTGDSDDPYSLLPPKKCSMNMNMLMKSR